MSAPTPDLAEIYAALVNVGELLVSTQAELRETRLEMQRVRLSQLAFEGRIVELDRRVTALQAAAAE